MRKLLCLLVFPMLLQSCGSDTSNSNSNNKYLSTTAYTFAAKVDPNTLSTAGSFGSANLSASSYVINTTSDLDAFNLMVSLPTPLAFNDLGAYSYFIVKEASCPSYSKYAGDSADAGSLTLNFDVYSLGNVACPALAGTVYDIYKAKKTP